MDPSAIANYLQQGGQAQPQQGGDMGAYMQQGQPDPSQAQQPTTPEQRWGAIQDSVNTIDEQAQGLGIPTHDLFKKLTSADYTGPNGVNWDKLMTDHKNVQLASTAP